MLVKRLKMILSAVLAIIINFLGDTSPFLKSIFALVIIDVILGLICAKFYRFEDIKTRRFVEKIRELGLFSVGLAAFIFSAQAFAHFGLSKMWGAKFYCSAYMIYELFSILENLGDMGFPIAKQIKEVLKKKIPTELQRDKNDKK